MSKSKITLPADLAEKMGGQVCHPLQTKSDWNAFSNVCIEADRAMGRPKLDGCRYSAISLGMLTHARVKVGKRNTRDVAKDILESGLRRVGLPPELITCLPDSEEYGYALDTLEDLVIGIVAATDQQRPVLAGRMWTEAAGLAREIIVAEGWEEILE
jgi:hypothetical protein